ncbi:MAG: serine--tRNA ligase [Candidatus Nanoarchaeia archaeon]|nr:serine--tRNA ligase [Candidatus Nanoarchaeia archaeon]
MLDIKFLRENPKIVKDSQRKRAMSEDDVDKVLELDAKWRKLKNEADNLRAERNKISQEINLEKKAGDEKKAKILIKKASDIPRQIENLENQSNKLEEERNAVLENIPNLVDKSVPVGDESKNKVLETFGKPLKLSFEPKSHDELLINLDMLNMNKAAEVAGARFYYLKRDLVKLNQALLNFALDFLEKKGFVLMQPPYMLKRKTLNSAMPFAAFAEAVYKIEGEDLYLIGTAEHALNAYYFNENISGRELPIKFAGISPCFRKEAGNSKDTKGIIRVHQFEKIEQFVFCKPEESWKEFDSILKNTIEIFKKLEIPFRTVVLATGDMGRVPTKTIDLQGWFPSQKEYKELGSCSNCLDYQSRRGNIRYDEAGKLAFVHTINNTAIATERMMACLVENHQQKDGSIKIPKALVPYMGGGKIMGAKVREKGKGKRER